MGWIYVARSPKLCKWGADVGVGKHLFKIGCTEDDVAPLLKAGIAGETDWTIVKKEHREELDEEAMLAKVARKLKFVDPNVYPKIKGNTGIVKCPPERVENHILLGLALEGRDLQGVKVKPQDFGIYLLHCAKVDVDS